MDSRLLMILTMGVVSLAALAIPNASAKFSLQHEFVNGSNVDCTSCHPRIHGEILSGGVHTTHGFATRPCRGCHIPSYGDGSPGGLPASSPYYNPYQCCTGKFHAAALVECTFCHFNNPDCTGCHTKANVTAEFENSSIEAHRPLYYRGRNASGADLTDMLSGVNEACIACHTQGANVSLVKPGSYLNITAIYSGCGFQPDCYDGWNISLSKM